MTDQPTTTLRLEHTGAVLSVVLNRPQVHDAFDDVMIAELAQVFLAVADDPTVRVVVLRSTGKHFSAGADLNWMRRMADCSETESADDARRMETMLRAIATCPKPVVARVQGAALGGGAGLVATADIAIASTAAQFGFTEARLGIVPGVISAYVLRKLPAGQAQALFLTGARFDALRARELGLIHEVVEPGTLDDAVDRVVDDLLAGSPEAQAKIKQLVPAIAHLGVEAAADVTVKAITEARASDDGKAGMTAFLDKVRPPWSSD
ncbi:MAG TPA: enoyl-CoA hydratase-related protein [Acidobacteriota bacterium]|nr:enoyl-CoA hydratase-related protein [Acidobacteriota bacterium]